MVSDDIQKQNAVDLHSIQADTFASRYSDSNQTAYSTCFAYSRHRLDLLMEAMLPERGEGLRLLDVGCGTGHYMARLRERGFDVAGVDGSEEMLKHARANNPRAELHSSDVDALPFPGESFDYIICIEVLRYLPDSYRCIREMARALKPGGVCLATAAPLLNTNGYWMVNRIANALPSGNLTRLKQFFTTSGRLRREFSSAGFASVEVNGVYAGPINWVERLARPALPRFLKFWEKIDSRLANRALLKEFSNMFLVRAVRDRVADGR